MMKQMNELDSVPLGLDFQSRTTNIKVRHSYTRYSITSWEY